MTLKSREKTLYGLRPKLIFLHMNNVRIKNMRTAYKQLDKRSIFSFHCLISYVKYNITNQLRCTFL